MSYHKSTKNIIKSNRNRAFKFNYRYMTNALAYVIGAYLGDGSICFNKPYGKRKHSSAMFQLQSIDLDFVKYLESQLLECGIKSSIHLFPSGHTGNSKPSYTLRACHTAFCKWLYEFTGGKARIPKFDRKSHIKNFLMGLFDSELTVCIMKSIPSRISPLLDFGIIDNWIYDVHKLCQDIDLTIGKIRSGYMKAVPNFKRFNINARSFIQNGFKLSIARKQTLLDNFESKLKD